MTSSRICRIRAFAAEGFEWVSTTRTWSRLTMTAALQFSMAVGFAIAPKMPGATCLKSNSLAAAAPAAGAACLSSATARTTEPQGEPLAAATSPAAFNRPRAWRRVSRDDSSTW